MSSLTDHLRMRILDKTNCDEETKERLMGVAAVEIDRLESEITQLKQERVCKWTLQEDRKFRALACKPGFCVLYYRRDWNYCPNCGGKIEIEEGR